MALAGCAGRMSYIKPTQPTRTAQEKILNQSYKQAWANTLQTFENRGYAVETADPSTGLIRLRVTGDPEPYVRCGQVVSEVATLRYKIVRTYKFDAAARHTAYEQITDGNIWDVVRAMQMDTVIDINLKPVGRTRTRAGLDTHYQVSRRLKFSNATHKPYAPINDTINFNYLSKGVFPNGMGTSTECWATGRLESKILNLIT
jgi:hypothetical protein